MAGYEFVLESKSVQEKLYKIGYLKITADQSAGAGLFNLDRVFDFPSKRITIAYDLIMHSVDGTDTVLADVYIRPDDDCHWYNVWSHSITGIPTTSTEFADIVNVNAGSLQARLFLHGTSSGTDTTTIEAGSWFQIILEGV